MLFFIFVIITYVVGARKLSGAVGKTNSVAKNIAATATKMALSMVLSVLGMLLCKSEPVTLRHVVGG